jgi:hypothetical protein
VNRKLILLTLVLLALAGWLSWMLRLKWIELHKHEHTVLAASPKGGPLFPPSPTPIIKQIAATDYIAIPQNAILFKDRNSNVILDPPPPLPPPPPPKPMPELPAYFGSMSISDPVVVLKLPKGAQKSYHAGEKVGPFLLVSFDRDKVVFDWDGKTVERKPEELKEKETTPQETVANPPPPVAPVTSGSNVTKIGGATTEAPKVSEKLGPDNGGGVRQCVKGDTSPVGSIVDGYKKVVTTNMFGETCMWQQVNQ